LPVADPVPVHIVERVGADINPVDAATEAGARRLAGYVWPDQPVRLERLNRAVAVARTTSARIVGADAAFFLADLRPQPGRLTVIWHSLMWQYLPRRQQQHVERIIDTVGVAATRQQPVAHLSLEADPDDTGWPDHYDLVARTWPDGRRRVLGRAPA